MILAFLGMALVTATIALLVAAMTLFIRGYAVSSLTMLGGLLMIILPVFIQNWHGFLPVTREMTYAVLTLPGMLIVVFGIFLTRRLPFR
ncbi:hypothetical protein [Larsenimonas rhizosphaerae]|uniref:Uncharacterized protein n=1 Tax=Larsenimonas rhizosphaerae TaxID=2944682 RepID=A0AA41ZPM1_9GAMM|nr:hypothetical protein [Larsenimonas rhizosphaerae]MCM2131789.1 hypothetical protein [Larsenimonas rhizosphaerae]MCX2524895.1 hypothetical protein [Larsenimonas rhizosphaerae]